MEALPTPFGYVGPSMLRRGPPGTSPTFQGLYDDPQLSDVKMTPLYTVDQLRAAMLEEREQNARICDERAQDCEDSFASDGDERWLVYAKHARRLAAAIRG